MLKNYNVNFISFFLGRLTWVDLAGFVSYKLQAYLAVLAPLETKSLPDLRVKPAQSACLPLASCIKRVETQVHHLILPRNRNSAEEKKLCEHTSVFLTSPIFSEKNFFSKNKSC